MPVNYFFFTWCQQTWSPILITMCEEQDKIPAFCLSLCSLLFPVRIPWWRQALSHKACFLSSNNYLTHLIYLFVLHNQQSAHWLPLQKMRRSKHFLSLFLDYFLTHIPTLMPWLWGAVMHLGDYKVNFFLTHRARARCQRLTPVILTT